MTACLMSVQMLSEDQDLLHIERTQAGLMSYSLLVLTSPEACTPQWASRGIFIIFYTHKMSPFLVTVKTCRLQILKSPLSLNFLRKLSPGCHCTSQYLPRVLYTVQV